MIDLGPLLRLGYFPKELPPTFRTHDLADFIKATGVFEPKPPTGKKHLISKPVEHSLARPGQLRRRLQIWNPFSYMNLASVLGRGAKEMESHFKKSTLSVSLPVEDGDGKRALVRAYDGKDLPEIRAKQRATGRFLLRTDFTRFYHSIYTHSVPWALHGKAWSKTHRTSGFGNELDQALRNGQDGQTLGIPVGPDASLVVAEIIGCAIDAIVQERFPNGFRFIDDWEMTFDSRSEAELALAMLEEAAAGFELALNPSKTVIEQLPQALETEWQHSIREFALGSDEPDSGDLLRYFNLVFKLQHEQKTEGVIPYAVARLRAASVDEDDWPLCQNLLFQCAIAEPASLTHVLSFLAKHSTLGIGPTLADVLDKIIQEHTSLGHGSEVAWALWGAMRFEQTLSAESAKAVSASTDPIVALSALHVRERGLFATAPDFTYWDTILTQDELYDESWILVYEAIKSGWLAVPKHGDPTKSDENFALLRSNDVSFYDVEQAEMKEPEEEEEYDREPEDFGGY